MSAAEQEHAGYGPAWLALNHNSATPTMWLWATYTVQASDFLIHELDSFTTKIKQAHLPKGLVQRQS